MQKPDKTLVQHTVYSVQHPLIQRARTLANLLENAFTIPIIRKKVGWDAILGLVPGFGDVVMMLVSLYILWVAIVLKLPPSIPLRMVVNIVIDLLLGTMPVAGDVVDFFWRSNQMNLSLLERAYLKHLEAQQDKSSLETLNPADAVINVTAKEVD